MADRPGSGSDVLAQAQAAWDAGAGGTAGTLFDQAIREARASGDLIAWTRAVLGAAQSQRFGPDPGRLPALLAEAMAAQASDPPRVQLAAALARSWAYAGQPTRAAPFAQQALDLARHLGEPALIADGLDAALTAHWGPEELQERRRLASELDEVTAHLLDDEARLRAHLWGLTVALEDLDVLALNRQARALEVLGEESPKARFFAASRRLALDLMRGRTDTAGRLLGIATEAAAQASLPDSDVVLQAMRSYTALHAGDASACEAAGALAEELADQEGLVTVAAEAAVFWVAAGRLDRARALVHRFEGRALEELPRDMDWLLVMQSLLQAALACEAREMVAQIVPLLTPFTGRAVVNGGGVMFHGVTDDPLSRAHALLGDAESAVRLRHAALNRYERAGAHWWYERLARSPLENAPRAEPASPRQTQAVFRRTPEGGWQIGPLARPVQLPALRGLGHLHLLLTRPGQEVPAIDLVSAAVGHPIVVQSGLGAVLDETARRAYRQRLRELDEDLAEADAWADAGRAARLRVERDALITELGAALGLGGASRNPGSSAERARVAVRKAIVAALDRLAVVDPVTARHLSAHTSTGVTCRYESDPDHPWNWVLG